MTSTVLSTKTESTKTKNALWRLMGFLKPHWRALLVIGVLIVLTNLTALLKPWFIKIITDEYIRPKQLTGLNGIPLWMISLGYIGVFFLGMGAFYLQVVLITKVGAQVSKTLRNLLFTTIQKFPLSYLDKTGSGRLITRTTNDVEAVTELFVDILVSLVKDAVLLVGIILAMARMNLELMLWAFIVIPPMMALVFFIRYKIHANWVQLKAITSKLNGYIAENISGMRIVQIFNGEAIKKAGFEKLNQEYFDRSLLQMRMHSFSGPSANVFESLASAIILVVGMKLLGQGKVELGVIVGMTMYIRQFFAPLADLADSFTQIESAVVSAGRIFEITDLADITEDLKAGQPLDIRGRVEFKNVWFAYDEEDWVLKDVSFTIEPGQSFAIIGETGSGKTTIISLLSGFYDIQRGEILIDGVNIRDIQKSSLRRQVAVVLQDVFLFSGTIRENITLNDDIPDALVQQAVEESQASMMLKEFPDGLDHAVMERGATFSMGQRQLLSFARALAHDPAIFVLDEATANIDTKTEQLIQKAIDNISQERTTIIIAHRLSTIRNADQILVLSQGEILEMGTHEELMARDSHYKAMVERGAKLPVA